MFGSGLDTRHDNTGVVPMRFMWPYGGRSVFLCGSFTGWSEHIPMSPLEGCPTVFQVICRLAPGHHLYKFFVDGEWRHDEHQPSSVSGSCGVVNTLYLPREPVIVPTALSSFAANPMEVDDIILRTEVSPRVSEADLEVSRQRISAYLSTHTACELLPESGYCPGHYFTC